jgi:hypothetical protein
MNSPKTWLTNKLNEPCPCKSDKPYKSCCVWRESIYLAILLLVVLTFFAAHEAFGSPIIFGVFIGSAVLLKICGSRK